MLDSVFLVIGIVGNAWCSSCCIVSSNFNALMFLAHATSAAQFSPDSTCSPRTSSISAAPLILTSWSALDRFRPAGLDLVRIEEDVQALVWQRDPACSTLRRVATSCASSTEPTSPN